MIRKSMASLLEEHRPRMIAHRGSVAARLQTAWDARAEEASSLKQKANVPARTPCEMGDPLLVMMPRVG